METISIKMSDATDTVREISLHQIARRLGVDSAIAMKSWMGAEFPKLRYKEINQNDQLRLERETTAALDEMAKLPALDQKWLKSFWLNLRNPQKRISCHTVSGFHFSLVTQVSS